MEGLNKKVRELNSLGYLFLVLFLTSVVVFSVNFFGLSRSILRFNVATPGIIALVIVIFIYKQKDNSFFWQQFKITSSASVWIFISLILYAVFSYLSTFISKLFFEGTFSAIPSFSIGPDRLLIIFILAFFEEIGWRGYALPLLSKKIGLTLSSLIIGIIWALWHFPGYLINFGAPTDIPFIVFSIWVIAASFLFTWLYFKSNRNVWTAVFLHAGANTALGIFPVMPGPAGTSATFYIMTTVVIIFATYITFIEFRKIKLGG